MDALKPNAKDWTIKEQIIRDPISGLTLQFDVCPGGSMRLRIFGDGLSHGHREIGWGANGEREWSAVGKTRVPSPGWVRGRT